jgi:hypothetical protein
MAFFKPESNLLSGLISAFSEGELFGCTPIEHRCAHGGCHRRVQAAAGVTDDTALKHADASA